MLEQDLEFIYQSLMPRTKMQISQLGNMLGCELKSNLRKSEMATGLADYIINRSDEWLRCLPQRELDLLEIMVKQHILIIPLFLTKRTIKICWLT